jgi:hypothetical protein
VRSATGPQLGIDPGVLGQLLDHVSALSQYRMEDLSTSLSGKLEEVLRQLSHGEVERYAQTVSAVE